MKTSNATEGTEWADANGQVDYFSDYNNDTIIRTALYSTSGLSISPLMSTRPSGVARSAKQDTYPSQELNPRHGNFKASPSNSDDAVKAPPFPPPTHSSQESNPYHGELELSPPQSDGVIEYPPCYLLHSPPKGQIDKVSMDQAKVFAPKDKAAFCPEQVTSMATGLSQGLSELTTHRAGQSHSLLDSFEVDLVGTESISVDRLTADERGNPKALPRVSTSPEDNPRKKPKRKTKTHSLEIQGSTGIAEPSPFDILRGRGGRTNRFPGNRKFRDEARKLRTTYRDHNTTREAKFHLSQVIKLSFDVPRVLSSSHTTIDFYMIAVGKTC